MDEVKEANGRMAAMRGPLSKGETEVVTELDRGSTTVEVPGAYNHEKPDSIPEPMSIPKPRLLSNYITAPCKHECNVIKKVRYAKQAHRVMLALNPIKQSLL